MVRCPSWSKETVLRSVVFHTQGFEPPPHYFCGALNHDNFVPRV
jgi:hypothetical protein